jgi:head-tail adaptor
MRSPRIRAGRLDRPISIEAKSETIDDYGAPVATWQALGDFRAELVTELRGDSVTSSTAKESGEVNSIEEVLTFRTRWIGALSIADRITYDGRAFEIIALTEIPRRRGWEIKARHRGL